MTNAEPSTRASAPVGDVAPLLSVRDLTICYDVPQTFSPRPRKVAVVQDVSFDVRPGETFGLVGESGSGKSTTGRAILQLLPAASGSIRFDGVEVTDFGRHVPLSYRRDVQAVFQDPSMSLNPRQPAATAVTMALRRHGVSNRAERDRRAAEAFEHVGLQRMHLGRYPSELSGGQQQRVAIARALALRPRLVVCDEATSALDLSTRAQILELLSNLQAETGMSYLFIAHDLGLVRHFCDDIAVMRSGHIVELAAAHDLFAAPQHPYTRKLLGATPSEHPRGRDDRREKRRAFALAQAEGLVPAV